MPKELRNLSNLATLHSENDRVLNIPSNLGILKKLQFFFFNQNNLTRTIPHSLPSLPSLINLLLASNDLNDQIPEDLSQGSKYNFTGFMQ